MFVPRLELEHAKSVAHADRFESYREYPDNPHPALILRDVLSQNGFEQNVGMDYDGYPSILGYQGPALSFLMKVNPVNIVSFVEHQMMLKSDNELVLIRESVTWANLAHRLLQRYTRAGVTETEVSLRASQEATLALVDALGSQYRSSSFFGDGPSAGYRGQIGRGAAIPHSLSMNATFQRGDVLVTGAGCPMWGYNSELERTMIVGKPSDRQNEFFSHMLALQQTAFDNIRPGRKCSEVDRAVRSYFEGHQLWNYWRHHSGHAIGLRYHEGPYLDSGDDTLLEPGMVFTVEPGLYVPELGGFRHSDTVVVTGDGIELLTYYPRELEALIV
jgi:Xaa-Pro aminopeptidase